jgi:3D (Asp-Asp-Asp) domain-containing protein
LLAIGVCVAAGAAIAARPAVPAAMSGCPPRPPDTARPITHARWLSSAIVTEYYPVRESWFAGPLVRARGIPGRHRASWLYGAHGVAMNGEGLGRDGRYYRFAGPYGDGWVNGAGRPTHGCWTGHWSDGDPARVAAPSRATFAVGRSSLPFWKTVAVDRHVVPRGSRVFIPAYCDTPAHGWFRALDTGGAIIGYHFDVYRAPPQTLELRSFRDQRVYVVPPGDRSSRAACPARA